MSLLNEKYKVLTQFERHNMVFLLQQSKSQRAICQKLGISWLSVLCDHFYFFLGNWTSGKNKE